MPNQALTDAIKEAYASVPTGVVLINTLEISHPALSSESLYLVNANKPYDLTLENNQVQTFQPFAFNFTLPAAGSNGLQELTITVDNVGRQVSDFLNKAKDYRQKASVIFRPYLSNDLTTPQLDPPLSLNLTDVKVTDFSVTGRATFADLLNKKFPLELYTRSRFPSLGG